MNALEKIYARIPAVIGCRTGCSDCCGPVPLGAEERGRINHLVQPESFEVGGFITPTKPGCLDCAYSTPSGCAIYDSRPFMCRLFGASVEIDRLRCPHGAKPERPLSKGEADRLTQDYLREITA